MYFFRTEHLLCFILSFSACCGIFLFAVLSDLFVKLTVKCSGSSIFLIILHRSGVSLLIVQDKASHNSNYLFNSNSQSMNFKTIILVLVLLAGWFETATAQNLIIRLTDGTESSQALTQVQKLTFPDGNLLVSLKNNTTETFALAGVQKVYFGTQTATVDYTEAGTSKLLLFPNPATSEINIKNLPEGTGTVYIFRANGQLQQQFSVSAGEETLNVSNLQPGLYILVANGQSLKFIKL